MPPKCKFSTETVIQSALEIVRTKGPDAMTARAVAAGLDASPKVIFGLFKNMEELQKAVREAANGLYQRYLAEDMAGTKYPPYKASGMAYIRFAAEQRELFKLLFMCDRSKEENTRDTDEIQPLIDLIRQNLGLTQEDATLFHVEMWIYVHGIATMIATGYEDWDTELVSRMLSDAYLGLTHRYTAKEQD